MQALLTYHGVGVVGVGPEVGVEVAALPEDGGPALLRDHGVVDGVHLLQVRVRLVMVGGEVWGWVWGVVVVVIGWTGWGGGGDFLTINQGGGLILQ